MSAKNLRREYAELFVKKKELEEDLAEVDRRMTQLTQPVLDDFVERGERRATIEVDGVELTLSPRKTTRLQVRPGVDRLEAAEAVAAAGLGDEYLRRDFNLNSLSSWAREELVAGRELPRSLLTSFRVVDDWKVGARRS